jgi:ring-1,2-phenylacetyl-CoA epoxidase subunit PaaD
MTGPSTPEIPAELQAVWQALEVLADPEIPVVSLRELGILRGIRQTDAGLEVVITPTYSGCPAMGQIEDDVRALLQQQGWDAKVVTHCRRHGPPTG